MLTLWAIVTLLGIGVGFAQEMQVLDQVRQEIVLLENGAGDVWDYSGSGGYVFRFSEDVLDDGAAESFVNVSVRPNVWHVFAGRDSKSYIGDIELSGSGFLLHREGRSVTLLDTYQLDAFNKYIIEQKITATGIQKSARKVEGGAAEKEYQAILNRQTSDSTTWVTPRMEGILVYDLLNKHSPKWFDFNPDKAQVRNGYYRLPGDEVRISEFEKVFTPQVALNALNQALGLSQSIDKQMTVTPNSSSQPTLVPERSTPTPIELSTPEPVSSPSATPMVAADETKPAAGFPIVPVAIFVVLVGAGVVFLLFRRKS